MAGRFDQPANAPQGGNATGFSRGFRPVPTVNYGAVNTPGVDRSQALEKQAANAGARADGIKDAAGLNMIATGIDGLGRVATAFDKVVTENISEGVNRDMERLESTLFGIPTRDEASALSGAPEGLRNEVAKTDSLVQASSTRTQVGGHFESRVLANMRQMQRKYPGWADVVEKYYSQRLGSNPRQAVIREARRAAAAARSSATSAEKEKRRMILGLAKGDLVALQQFYPGIDESNIAQVLGDPSVTMDTLINMTAAQRQYENNLDRVNKEASAGDSIDTINLREADKATAGVMEPVINSVINSTALPDGNFEELTGDVPADLERIRNEWQEFDLTGDTQGLREASVNFSDAVDNLENRMLNYYKGRSVAYNNPKNAEYVQERVTREIEPLRELEKALRLGDGTRASMIIAEQKLMAAAKTQNFEIKNPWIAEKIKIADEMGDAGKAWLNDQAKQRNYSSWQQLVLATAGNTLTRDVRTNNPNPTTVEQALKTPVVQEPLATGASPVTGKALEEPGKAPAAEMPLQVVSQQISLLKATRDPAQAVTIAKQLFSDGSLIENIRPEVRRRFYNLMTDQEVAVKMGASSETQFLYRNYLSKAFVTTNLLALRDVGPRANSYWETMQTSFDPKTGFGFRDDEMGEGQGVISSTWERVVDRNQVINNIKELNADYVKLRNAAVVAGLNPEEVARDVASYDFNRNHPEWSERKGRSWNRLMTTVQGWFTSEEGSEGGEEASPFQ